MVMARQHHLVVLVVALVVIVAAAIRFNPAIWNSQAVRNIEGFIRRERTWPLAEGWMFNLSTSYDRIDDDDLSSVFATDDGRYVHLTTFVNTNPATMHESLENIKNYVIPAYEKTFVLHNVYFSTGFNVIRYGVALSNSDGRVFSGWTVGTSSSVNVVVEIDDKNDEHKAVQIWNSVIRD